MSFVSYAQNFEDVMLWRALRHIKRGFYIDVGANDPTIDSVTRAFYDCNWHGINIEPLNSHYADLERERPKDINLRCAAGSELGEIDLWEPDIRGWATADKFVIEQHSQAGYKGVYQRVPVVTLENICDKYVTGDIHFLKIDVEGFEEAVLKGANFERHRPWIIVIEATKPNSKDEIYEQWEHLILKKNYLFAYADGLNRFYVAGERDSLLKALIYPPNILDDFVTANRLLAEAKAQDAEAKAQDAEAKAQDAEAKAQVAEAKAQDAEAKAQVAEAKAQVAEAKVQVAEAKVQVAEAKVQVAEAKVQNIAQSLSNILSHKLNQIITKITMGSEIQDIKNSLSAYLPNKTLRTIAIDLTPVLPGGENGGAKIFVLELLRLLAEIAPRTQFVLLTQAASHEELAVLDKINMRRLMVVGPVSANSLRPRLIRLAARFLPHLPVKLHSVVSRLGYKLNTILKRAGSSSLLRDMGADLLFCPFTAPTYFEPGIPTISTIYDLQYKTYPTFFTSDDVAHRERTFLAACRRATVLTAISDYSRNSAISHGSLDPNRIRTIHLRMAQRIVPGAESNKALLVRLGLTSQQYLIYPANFWKHKNHEMLLTAFGMACQGRLAENIKLVCTGAPGQRQEWLMSATHTMNLSERVIFPGYLPSAELATLMANCSGMVFPSLYEGFGLPVIEAMAAGVPVACSNTTSLPEVAADAAILFDPRVPTQIVQAMISLVEDKTLRSQLIQAGLQRAAVFSDSERMAREYWELFQYALDNETHENVLTGVYADGWAGQCINIQVAPAVGAQTLEIEFSAPEWLPQQRITVQTYCGEKDQGKAIAFVRGTNAVLSLPMDPTGGYFEIMIAPTFVPACTGHGDDQRELSTIVQRCGIFHADGEYIELFPEKVPV